MKHPLETAVRLALVAAVCAPGLRAQDSVSKLAGLPGDALNPYDTAEQINDYVLDLTAFNSSWSNTFGIGPLAKASAQRTTLPVFFTSAFSAQTLSRGVAGNVPFLRNSYMLWNGAGLGVNNNPARNDPGTPVGTVGATGFQFGFGFAEFGDGSPSGTSLNNMIGGVVNFQGTRPSRLFVSRITAATGGSNEGCAVSSFGCGGVDEAGNLHFRADNNLTTNAGCQNLAVISGNNLFRVRMPARTATQNVLSDSFPTSGDVPATDWLLVQSTTTHACPNLIPNMVAGRPILIGLNAPAAPPGQYVHEQVAGSLTTLAPGAHLAGLSDHRGGLAYSMRNYPQLFPGTVSGTGAVQGRAGAQVDSFAIFGLDANGGVLSPIARTLPAVISDPDQAWNSGLIAGTSGLDHYHGSTLFRASPAQVALGQDQAGRLLTAGVVYYGGLSNVTPNCYIAVARTNPSTGATTWSVAAWTKDTAADYGKNIYQNGTTVIGRLKPFGTPGSGTGPTMSAPMIDSVGNVWFVGPFELSSSPGTTQVGLLRAVYQPATFSYRLEVVFKQGDVFGGQNSRRNYRIGFIPLNGAFSISPSAPWSQNIAETSWQNQPTAGLSTSDAATLGGIVIVASITYDVNNDGMYVPASGTPGSPDEDYQVLLYVSPASDCDGDGIPDDAELADGLDTDVNANGIPDSCEGVTGTPFCFGDGTGTACPCANQVPPGTVAGCTNSLGTGGTLLANGNASLSNDTIVLQGSGMPNSSALYFQGTNQQGAGAGTQFGDGKRCAGGAIARLRITTNVGGASQYPFGGNPSVSVKGLVTMPGTRTYQVWYRNAAAFCTPATFNLSNGLELTWVP